MKRTINKRNTKNARAASKLLRAIYIIICALPVLLTAIFYALRPYTAVMDWIVGNISAPVREFLGLLSSLYPFSMMEALCTVAVIWLIYYLIRTVVVTVRRRGKLKILSKRILMIAVVALYIWGLYSWLWNSGYFATGFAARNGFSGNGVATDELVSVTRLFADKANEFAVLVNRDGEGFYAEDRSETFAAFADVYHNIASVFPELGGKLYRPKPMLFSWLMSRTGYTGIYFALTGESNININAPGVLMPATIAHELAHQHGIFAEDEANFVGIAACVTSENAVYEYAGWLMGLMYLSDALSTADPGAWRDIGAGLSQEVNRDWQENYDYWQSQKTVDTGIKFVDNILNAVVETAGDTVDSVYDSFLKSQSQELGIKSYGACVDLLVQYFMPK